ncbi:MAG: amidohydrolase family protein [Cyclobacteriaceae bacterium]|nr:amidohydrolase family protein [Cyclobacteriaceae bacterium]
MKNSILSIIFVFIFSSISFGQATFPINDVKDERIDATAFINANIVTTGESVLRNATMLVKDGRIVAIGTGISIPSGYKTFDVKGNYLYPSFIDLNTSYGLPALERVRGGGWGGVEQIQSKTDGAYNGNQSIKSEYNASDEFTVQDKEADKYRKMGFGTVLSFKEDGLARGTSTLVTLGSTSENKVMLKPVAAAHYSFNRGTSRQSYPVSSMGFIALLRQTYLDASWYGAQKTKPYSDKSLDAWIESQSLPQFFDAGGWLNALRADKLGDEFKVQYIIRGGGDEYQRMNEIKATNASLIIPLNFPAAFDVDDPLDAQRVSLADMKHWELAPANPAWLEKNGISFAITSDQSGSNFWDNLRKAVEYGLSKRVALNALTSVPASYLRVQDQVGTLEKGKLANFIITSGDLFESGTVIYENWIQGSQFVLGDINAKDRSGEYTLSIGEKDYKFKITGEPGKHAAEINITDTTTQKVNLKIDNELVSMNFNSTEKGNEGLIRLTGWSKNTGFQGEGIDPKGNWMSWSAVRTGDVEKKEKSENGKKSSPVELGDVIYPFVAYGSKEMPKQETILIKNATVWTNEKEGILENTDVLLKGGKIAKIGKNLTDQADRTIDGTGKHVTSGIIDEHSHLGASSINDAATNSGMVRIGDVINSEAIGLYRALAGGVTALQILHGSANPIGGQSALIKLRWGASPEELKIKGADGYIKFALGENVKRTSNSSSIRFPQSRMGVEQVYMDAFSAAVDYEKEWKAYNALSKKEKLLATPPRRDLAMETMVEIINGERFISCHSYVQSEINMLMNVAEKFGFRINTFTHILEGYKVADKMKEHGVGASTFSDWWNYKWEVRYAIPYNATIMNNEGVVTAINSDDAEMIRRLNQEAAKSIKYGGTSEEDALKMVTLNPAKLLHLDQRMGSIKTGKDADVVVWSGHPLSVYAKPEQTIIDGIVYFDLKKDQQHREYIASERARIIEKMKGEKQNGGKVERRRSSESINFHCEDLLGVEADHVQH